MEYKQYLRSAHWRRVRHAFWNVAERRCSACGTEGDAENPLCIHHCTYEHLGHEEWGDLVALCKRCHDKVHRLIDNGQAPLHEAHLKIGSDEEISRTGSVRGKKLRADNHAAAFDVASVPVYVEEERYSSCELDAMATYLLWSKRTGKEGMILSNDQWKRIRQVEIYTDGITPDPSYTRDRFGNYIDGMYWRTHPQGRQWSSAEARRDSGAAFYRRGSATRHEILPPSLVLAPALCGFPGCGWDAVSHGWCMAHRGQEKLGIPLRPVKRHQGKSKLAVALEAQVARVAAKTRKSPAR